MKITESQFVKDCDDYNGYCPHCDQVVQYGEVEPDARGRECPECSRPYMMGVESALVEGLIEIGGDA